MKFSTTQVLVFFGERRTQRNIRALVKFIGILISLIVLYSVVFHFIMMHEGQKHSWVTGFYWTLTVMSTLGFGDISRSPSSSSSTPPGSRPRPRLARLASSRPRHATTSS